MKYKILNKKYQIIAKEFDITLHLIKPNDKWHKSNGDIYFNKSYVAGNEMWIGLYCDSNKMIASFFHELGHILLDDCSILMPHLNGKTCHPCSKVMIETCAWKKGLELAKTYNFKISQRTLKWIRNKCINTYDKYK